jgi:Amt family ammonium transporter
VVAGALPFFACTKLKSWIGYDDALDTFGVHGVGGTTGALLTGVFACTTVNGNLALNLNGVVGHTLWIEQLKAMGFTIVMSLVATAILTFAIKALIGLRPSEEVENQGLDINEHGEEGYIYADSK